MQINSSEFTISSPTVSRCPNDNKAEYAFIGRSNVGKSSLINMLCNHKGLANPQNEEVRIKVILRKFRL